MDPDKERDPGIPSILLLHPSCFSGKPAGILLVVGSLVVDDMNSPLTVSDSCTRQVYLAQVPPLLLEPFLQSDYFLLVFFLILNSSMIQGVFSLV